MGWCPPHFGSRLALPRFRRQNPGTDQPSDSGNMTRKDSVLVGVRCFSGFRSPAGLRIPEHAESSNLRVLILPVKLVFGDKLVQSDMRR